MKELDYLRAESPDAAVDQVAHNKDACFLGGGTNLVDHLKLGVASPDLLVDISRLPLNEVEEFDDGTNAGVRIGANVRNSDLAAHPLMRSRYPAVVRALLSGASGQIRHQATTGGNLLQRTRCVYFQDVSTPCNKREPGSGCSAVDGYGRYNAILGASPQCVATHPSDLAVALCALEATVLVTGPEGGRRIPIDDFHRLPGTEPSQDTTLDRADLVTAVELPASPLAARSTYVKVRDRASYAFALVSVAAALELDGDTVRDVRIAWGGVAHKPWRAREAESTLIGGRFSERGVREAAERELVGALLTEQTTYKAAMVRNATVLALGRLAEGRRS